MDITIKCDGIKCESLTNRNIEVTINGATLDGFVGADEIVNEYSASTLLDEIDNDDIIKHIESQGYTVTED
ncbi:hypothetical protein [Providencia sp. PROV019]|uniref:hypothetical protein n=1 Tax=Providencia sp. PROV019 TaxID=2949754 RepID=UPI00234956E8|nr:hypothetical protein [Providencia sp. PROV019]